ncbi:MAG: energy transducer TonB [Chthoniobacterales bacterium]
MVREEIWFWRLFFSAAVIMVCAWLGRDAVAGEPPLIRPGQPYPPSALHWPASAPDYDIGPKLLRGNAPIYPITQAFAGNSGEAVVSFPIGVDGAAHDIRVVSATYPYFGSHLAVAVRDWKFEPARKNGHAVAVKVRRLVMPFGGRWR